MTMQDKWLRVPLADIVVRRADRQRRAVRSPAGEFLDSDNFLQSIRDRGVINAIIVRAEPSGAFVLVAGERRLEASRELGLPDIPVRFAGDLSDLEHAIIELEENLKRTDLPWRDEVAAIARLHSLYCVANPGHTHADSERLLGYTQVTEALRVSKDMTSVRIAHCTRLREAYNILSRFDDRATDDAVNDIIEASRGIFGEDGAGSGAGQTAGESPGAGSGAGVDPRTPPGANPQPTTAPVPASILHVDFHKWAEEYSGPGFNFIHCDFPYGVDAFGGGLISHARTGGKAYPSTRGRSYDDTPDVYVGLIRTLCLHLPKLLTPSAHLMFWLSADTAIQWRTLELFRELAPSLTFWPKPLIWHKTDNAGILSDHRRGPRHIYESALVASQEDRFIAKAVADTYGAPTDTSKHPSTKPEPMLRHFFQMFVDDGTKMLDPTCGSGAALRAAESLGARSVLGLEADREFYETATSALRSFRLLRKTSR
jgi:ParB/RepB/Spo0J family partition protein